MGQWEQSLLWQGSDETPGKLVHLSSSGKCLLFEQPSGNTVLQGVSPIYCPHLHKTEIFKRMGFAGYIFCRWHYAAAAWRLLWLSLLLNTEKATGLRRISSPTWICCSSTNNRFHWYSKKQISFSKTYEVSSPNEGIKTSDILHFEYVWSCHSQAVTWSIWWFCFNKKEKPSSLTNFFLSGYLTDNSIFQ